MAGPTATEQQLLEYINEARLDPLRDAARYIASYAGTATSADPGINASLKYFGVNGSALLAAYDALTPVQPVAWSEQLASSARAHDAAMITADSQQHVLPGEADVGTRITATGYAWQTYGENIFAYSQTPLYAQAGFMVDWGTDANGMQTGAGHRVNIMNPSFREVGVGITDESNPATAVGPEVVTEDFAARAGVGTIILGVAYNDADHDDFYSVGEGLGTLTVTLPDAAVTSYATGGYTLMTAHSGPLALVYSGGGLTAPENVAVNVAPNSNIKIDIVNGTELKTSTSVTVSGPVTRLEVEGVAGLSLAVTSSGTHTLVGGVGNDTLTGGPGNDTLIGGGGRDTAMFASALAQNVIAIAGNGNYTVTGPGGVDTLTGITILHFADTGSGLSGIYDVNAAYQTFFGRDATQPELGYWGQQLASGGSLPVMRSVLLADPIGQAHVTATITGLYDTYFGRDPSVAEATTWRSLFTVGADGASLRSTLLADASGQAHTTITVTTLYDTYFGRDPSSAEIVVWKGLIADGADFGALRAVLVGDASGLAHTTNIVTTLYDTYFGRDPSATEISVWKGLIAGGADFSTVRTALLGDATGVAHTTATVTTLYDPYFGRDPSAGETAVWKGLIANGADFGTLRSALLADPAGQAHTTATVTTLYDSYFGRDPTSGEIGVWQGLIGGGDTFDQLRDTLERVTTSATVTHAVGTSFHDVFSIAGAVRNLTVDGFDPGNDTVAISRAAYGSLNPLNTNHAREIFALDGSTDVLVTLDATHSVLFEHTHLSALHASDFATIL